MINNVLGETILKSKSVSKNAIDVSNLSSGVYILSVSTEDRAKQLKFIEK